jgi:hypothetical protein
VKVFPVRAAMAVICGLATATGAAAQVSARVTGGVTSAASEAPFVGAGLAARVKWFEVEGEVGRMVDILPDGLLDRLNELQRERDLPVRAVAKLPATYALGTLRLVSSSGPVQPFVTVGAGIARLEPTFEVVVAGVSLGDVFGLTSSGATTEPLVTAGGGLRIDLRRAVIDLGYRYLAVYTDFGLESGLGRTRSGVNVVYGAIGIVF